MSDPTHGPPGWPTPQQPSRPPVGAAGGGWHGGGPPTPMGPGPGAPPPGRKTPLGLVLGIVGVMAVLTLMLGISAVWILTSGDDDTEASSPPPTEATPTETTATEVAPTTSPPTSAPPTSSPTTPPTSRSPTDDRIRAADYASDWNYRFGDSEAFAAHQHGWDHATCAPVEVDRAFTRLGCEYAVEVTYRSAEGDLQLTNIFIGMSDEASATSVANDMTGEQFDMQRASFHPDGEDGLWRTRSVGKIVLLTVVTAPATTPHDRIDHYVRTANTDFSTALTWR